MKQIKLLIVAVIAVIILATPEYTKAEIIGYPNRVIYIQNGATVTDKNWNNGATFTVFTYGDSVKLNQAINIAKNHFNTFDVLVTTDEMTYNSFDALHRTKIIVGSTNVLGKDTGYSFNNSYMWGEDTPGFVLTNNCNPASMATDIGHLIAHEAGHIFGLEHTLRDSKSIPYGIGFIMSNFTGKKYVTWSSEDMAVLIPILGLKSSNFIDN